MSTHVNTFFDEKWESLSADQKRKWLKERAQGFDLFIAFIDDEEGVHEEVLSIIEDLGFNGFATTSYEELRQFTHQTAGRLALLITDFRMPQWNGFEVIQKLKDEGIHPPSIVLSGNVDKEMTLQGVELGVQHFFEKPLNREEFVEYLKSKLSNRVSEMVEEFELLNGFLDDAHGLVEQIESLLISLEQDPQDREIVSNIFGLAHTIKGTSGFFKPKTLHNFLHAYESSYNQVLRGEVAVSSQVISAWLLGLDAIKEMIQDFKSVKFQILSEKAQLEQFEKMFYSPVPVEESLELEEATRASKEKKKDQETKDLKVSAALMDDFMHLSGEMTVLRNMINKVVRALEKQYAGDKDIVQLGELLEEFHKVNSQIQGRITEIRKVPLKQMIRPVPRLVRELMLQLKKDVEFKTNADQVRVDASISESFSKILTHLIRNSMDHGIESPEQRSSSGKNSKGVIELNSYVEGDDVIFVFQDDGRGIQPEAIRKKLLSHPNYKAEEVMRWSDDVLRMKIFDPGFSTADVVSEVSGRGVGMSFVKETVEQLRGEIKIQSKVGEGTKFIFKVPLPKSVTITNCLFVQQKEHQYGIPQSQVMRVVNIDEDHLHQQIEEVAGGYVFKSGHEIYPLIPLNWALSYDDLSSITQSQLQEVNFKEKSVMLLKTEKGQFALMVDRILDIEDTVIKALSFNKIKNIGLFLGGTFLGDGSVGLILNVEGVAQKFNLSTQSGVASSGGLVNPNEADLKDVKEYVLFKLNGECCFALEEESVQRVEEIAESQVVSTLNQWMAPYRGSVLQMIALNECLAGVEAKAREGKFAVIVVKRGSRQCGLVVDQVLDLTRTAYPVEKGIEQSPYLKGSVLIQDQPVAVLNLDKILSIMGEDGVGPNVGHAESSARSA